MGHFHGPGISGWSAHAAEISVAARLFLFAAGTAARLAFYPVHVFGSLPGAGGEPILRGIFDVASFHYSTAIVSVRFTVATLAALLAGSAIWFTSRMIIANAQQRFGIQPVQMTLGIEFIRKNGPPGTGSTGQGHIFIVQQQTTTPTMAGGRLTAGLFSQCHRKQSCSTNHKRVRDRGM
ncbi:MAG: hypothetical protein ACXVKH_14565 [Candidatus Angelobacter sp.]